MQLSKPFDGQALVDGLKSAGLKDAEKLGKIVVSTVICWLIGSFAFLVAQGQALWGVASSLFQMVIPLITTELEKLTGEASGSWSISGSPMPVTKAFDLQALLNALKVQGVPELEKVAEDVIGVIFDWLESSFNLMAVSQPLWGMVAPLLATIQPLLDKELEHLAGVEAKAP